MRPLSDVATGSLHQCPLDAFTDEGQDVCASENAAVDLGCVRQVGKIHESPARSQMHERQLRELSSAHHEGCLFRLRPPVENWRARFTEQGVLEGEFCAHEAHQGYDDMMHGGLAAAIVDASMAQCLMGHGIAAYTAELNLKYSGPVRLHTPTRVSTRITGDALRKLFYMETTISQKRATCVIARAKFFRIN